MVNVLYFHLKVNRTNITQFAFFNLLMPIICTRKNKFTFSLLVYIENLTLIMYKAYLYIVRSGDLLHFFIYFLLFCKMHIYKWKNGFHIHRHLNKNYYII